MAENESLRQQLAALQAAYDAHLASVAQAEKQTLLRQALTAAGVTPQIADLLAGQVDMSTMVVENGTFTNAAEVLSPLRNRWSQLFLTPVPVTPMTPEAAKPLTKEQLATMTAEEINSNWAVVKALMAQ